MLDEEEAYKSKSEDPPLARQAFPFQSEQLLTHLVILAVCGAAFGLTFLFDEVPAPLKRGMAPEVFPRVVSLMALLLTCVSLSRTTRIPAPNLSALPSTFYYSVAGCVLFLLIANFIDLLVAMSLFIASICWMWGERRKPLIAALAVALPFLIFALFSELLGIRFPRGLLVNLIYG